MKRISGGAAMSKPCARSLLVSKQSVSRILCSVVRAGSSILGKQLSHGDIREGEALEVMFNPVHRARSRVPDDLAGVVNALPHIPERVWGSNCCQYTPQQRHSSYCSTHDVRRASWRAVTRAHDALKAPMSTSPAKSHSHWSTYTPLPGSCSVVNSMPLCIAVSG